MGRGSISIECGAKCGLVNLKIRIPHNRFLWNSHIVKVGYLCSQFLTINVNSFLLSGASLESPSRNIDSPMDLVGQCLFPVWAHQCHIVSNNLRIVNAPIKSMINGSLGDNGSGCEWSHFPPSIAGCGFKDCNNIHGSGENHTFFLTVYCNEEPSCHNFINGNDGSLWKWQQQHKHGNVSLCSLIWCHVDDVGGDFLPWCWWAFLAMMMMGQNSLLAKCNVVAPQNRCRTNVTKTECECRQSLTHLLTRKNNVVQKKMFFDNLNLTSWQTVQSSNVFGGKYILLAIFSSLLD